MVKTVNQFISNIDLIFFKNFRLLPKNYKAFSALYKGSFYFSFLHLKGCAISVFRMPQVFALLTNKTGLFQAFTASNVFFKENSSIVQTLLLTKKLIFGTIYGYYNIIQFVGFRYRQRWFRGPQVLKYRVGYSKKVWVKCPFDFITAIRKISPKKRTHFFAASDRFKLRRLIEQIHEARPSTRYKGRGVNIKEQPMVLKEGKKALW
jgi:ribosomal protein L6P/L9E